MKMAPGRVRSPMAISRAPGSHRKDQITVTVDNSQPFPYGTNARCVPLMQRRSSLPISKTLPAHLTTRVIATPYT
jgi:hypothetical protein